MRRKRLGQHLIEVLTKFVKDFEAGKVKPPRYKITTYRNGKRVKGKQ